MTTVYFVRHARPNYQNPDNAQRELTEQGRRDCKLVTDFLEKRQVDAVLSSPYRRCLETLADYAEKHGYPVRTVAAFREREISDCWVDDLEDYYLRQWRDFDYKYPKGESLRETQARNIMALHQVLSEYQNQSIVIGTHGTALTTIMNYYDRTVGYETHQESLHKMPWIVEMQFEGILCKKIQAHELCREPIAREGHF